MEIGSRYLENLQMIVDSVIFDFQVEGKGKQFLDYYWEWKGKNLSDLENLKKKEKSKFAGLGRNCYICNKTIEDKVLTIKNIITPSCDGTYYFHPSCFDTLVIKNYLGRL